MEKSRNGGAPSRGDTRQASRNFFDADHDDDFSSYFKKKSTNPFDDEDESDGPLEAFQHRKSCSEDEPRGFGSRSNYPNSPFDLKNSPEEKPFPSQQTHLQKIQAINDRTLATTTRSLQLIDESEAVGTAAAQELLAQREQLENASKNLDNMNATLDQSQKHINHIRSIFGGVKNWWSSKGSVDTPATALSTSESSDKLRTVLETSSVTSGTASRRADSFGDMPRDVPLSNPKAAGSPFREPSNTTKYNVDAALDQNLDQMSSGLGRLKMLAEGLGGEIESQNKLLDSINPKAEKVEVKMGEQQKLINRILGKK